MIPNFLIKIILLLFFLSADRAFFTFGLTMSKKISKGIGFNYAFLAPEKRLSATF